MYYAYKTNFKRAKIQFNSNTIQFKTSHCVISSPLIVKTDIRTVVKTDVKTASKTISIISQNCSRSNCCQNVLYRSHFQGSIRCTLHTCCIPEKSWGGASFLTMIFLCNIAQRVSISKIGQFGQGARPREQCL